jgi:hypothetical protein
MLLSYISSPETITEGLALGHFRHNHGRTAKSDLKTWEEHWSQLNDAQQGSDSVDPR